MVSQTASIALLCSSRNWGGLEQSMAHLATWLQADGMEVRLLCCPGTPLFAHAERLGVAVACERQRQYFPLGAAYGLAQQLAKWGNPPLLIGHNRDMDLASWAHRLGRGQFALWYWQHMRLGIDKKGFFQRMRHERLTGWLSPLPYLRDEVIERTTVPAEKVYLVPPGVDMKLFEPQGKSKDTLRLQLGLPLNVTLMGLAGRLEPRKNQEFAIRALRQLPIDIHLAIIGEASLYPSQPSYLERLRDITGELGLNDRVHFLPFATNTAPFYHAIDLDLMCTDGETYGLVTAEALASGTPVVGSRSGGTRDILGEGRHGFMYEPGNTEDFCRQVNLLLSNPVEARKRTLLGHAYVEAEASRQVVVRQIRKLVLQGETEIPMRKLSESVLPGAALSA